jgi:hypothetical protein
MPPTGALHDDLGHVASHLMLSAVRSPVARLYGIMQRCYKRDKGTAVMGSAGPFSLHTTTFMAPLARATAGTSSRFSHCITYGVSHFIPQDALSGEARDSLAGLKAAGWVRTYRHAGRDDVVVPTLPAAYLVELADVAGDELGRRAEADPHAAAVWLGRRLEAIYLGDLIGAQAIRGLANKTGGFSSGIIEGLLSIEPRERLVERALIALAAPDGQLVHIKIENGKALPLRPLRRGPRGRGRRRGRAVVHVRRRHRLDDPRPFARLPTGVVATTANGWMHGSYLRSARARFRCCGPTRRNWTTSSTI